MTLGTNIKKIIQDPYRLAQIGLVFTTLAWGATFVMVKEGLNDAPPFAFSSYRFLIASLCSLLIVRFDIFNVTYNELKGALWCGFFLFLGYAFQNFGLWENEFYVSTTPSKSAFITSVSVILVPIILSIFRIKKVGFKIWISVSLATSWNVPATFCLYLYGALEMVTYFLLV